MFGMFVAQEHRGFVSISAFNADPEAAKVRHWRHVVQKGFLVPYAPPKEHDLPVLDALFSEIESYDMTMQYLLYSKIGKVMRHLHRAETVPGDEQYHFRARAKALVDKWTFMASTSVEYVVHGVPAIMRPQILH